MEALITSRRLAVFLAQQVNGVVEIINEPRERSAAVCFGVAQDHFTAIVALLALESPIHSSAFALGRPLYESLVRGRWLLHCATDEQIDRYHIGSVPNMPQLLAALRSFDDSGQAQSLERIYENSWGVMCSMTHTGSEHYQRWSFNEVLEPAYDEAEVTHFLDFAARIALVSTAWLAFISKADGELWKRVVEGGKKLMPPRIEGSGMLTRAAS